MLQNAQYSAALTVLLGLASIFAVQTSYAHGGGLNAAGCHNDRKNGGYHCHGAKAESDIRPSTIRNNLAADDQPQPRPSRTQSDSSNAAGCYTGPRGGTYTLTASGRKNYSGC